LVDLEKYAYAIISIIIGIVATYPYIRDVFRGKTKPHLYTWLVWGISAAIIFIAMLSDGAGIGAWVTGFFVIKCIVYCILALKWGEKDITRSDSVCLAACLLSIPVWMITNDPLYAVILLVAIEAIAFYPTFRKSWLKPGEETISNYNIGIIQSALSLLALQNYTALTMLYASSIIAQNFVFILYLLWRRRVLLSAKLL
jgi:hypothetical protein